jgi:hypothetical protein
VLIGKDGRPRVADFGLARMESNTGRTAVSAPLPAITRAQAQKALLSPVTQAGVVMGTPLYMSPEQHLGDLTDSRSDQFSFCVALYEALYGKLPFAGNTLEALAFNTISGKVLPRPAGTHIPSPVHQALLRGLSPNPSQRFATMAELLTALSYDPTVDLGAGPKVRQRVTISMILVILIVALGMNVMQLLGIQAVTASLLSYSAFFAVFVILTFRFRRALRNTFHRGWLVYGLVFTGQILAFRILSVWLKLTYAQLCTLDLVALAAMNGVAATLVMPNLWPVVPLAIIAALLAAMFPIAAPTLSVALIVLQICMSLLLWNRAAGMRTPSRRKKRDSTDALSISSRPD